tara:strand:+ start:1156 stop:2283 length:1128 start_codon:yes stop_codon:yes gene_type:complete
MKFFNKYTYLFIGIIGIIAIGIFIIIPNFQTEEFDQGVIEDIAKGVSTTTVFKDNEEDLIEEMSIQDESFENISDDEVSEIEEILKINKVEINVENLDAYLLIGSDERSDSIKETRGAVQGRRADVIILGLVDKETNEMSLLSLPRDLLVINPCTNKMERINGSFNKNDCGGNAENLAATILNISGIKINHFASFNFEGFEEIIDSIGGIEICLEETQREGFSFEIQKGCQTVMGLPALNWVVSRNTEILVGEKIIDKDGNDISEWKKMPGVSDLTRVVRQQYIVTQLLNELNNFESIAELNKFVTAVENTFIIDENITINKAVEILWSFRNIDLENIQKLTAPVLPYELKDGRQVLVLSQNLYEFLTEKNIINQ